MSVFQDFWQALYDKHKNKYNQNTMQGYILEQGCPIYCPGPDVDCRLQ